MLEIMQKRGADGIEIGALFFSVALST